MKYLISILFLIISNTAFGQKEKVIENILALQFDSAKGYVSLLSTEDRQYFSTLTEIWESGGQTTLDTVLISTLDNRMGTELLMGCYNVFKGNRSEALAQLMKATDQLQQTNDPLNIIGNLAILHLYSRIILSSDAYSNFLSRFKTLSDHRYHQAWYHIHSLNYLEKTLTADYDKSNWLRRLNEAEIFFEIHEINSQLNAHLFTKKGLYFKAEEEDAWSIEAFQKSVQYCANHLSLRYLKFLNLLDLAGLKLKQNELKESKNYLDMAKSNWDNSDPVLSELNYYSILAYGYYGPAGQWEQAFQAMDSLMNVNLQFFFESNNMRMVEMMQEFEAEKRDLEIEDQKSYIDYQSRLLWIALAFVLVLAVLSVALFRAGKSIQRKNKKIEILLRELHHRVKNNLQVISSLLGLQAIKLEDENAKKAVSESKHRIGAMSLIHQKLYQNERVTGLNLSEYIQGLVDELARTYGFREKIDLDIDIFEGSLDTDTSLNLGLIINELVSNAFKYAFQAQDHPTLRITLSNDNADEYVLKVQDNGTGLPPDFELDQNDSFGMKLVRLLVKQIKGSLQVESRNGVEWMVHFKAQPVQ